MKGKLYGIGIGPGDPELLTLKAVRLIREADVIAVPGKVKTETVAYQITVQAVPEIADKECVEVYYPMSKDPEILEKCHTEAAEKIETYLAAGKTVAFLTLGDTTVYSTYIYVHTKLLEKGYEAEIVSGITSFCAVAARLNMGLVEKAEELHIIPASYQIEEALKLKGTKVLMKAASKMGEVKKMLKDCGQDVVMIENCGMPGEKIHRSVDEIPEDASYYSLIIVKEK